MRQPESSEVKFMNFNICDESQMAPSKILHGTFHITILYPIVYNVKFINIQNVFRLKWTPSDGDSLDIYFS